jgi:hypothetical protein
MRGRVQEVRGALVLTTATLDAQAGTILARYQGVFVSPCGSREAAIRQLLTYLAMAHLRKGAQDVLTHAGGRHTIAHPHGISSKHPRVTRALPEESLRTRVAGGLGPAKAESPALFVCLCAVR